MAHEPIVLWTFIAVVLGGIAVMAADHQVPACGAPSGATGSASIDHKKIGIMYMILGIVMLLRGFADAVMMRIQQAMAFGDNLGYLPPHHYDQIFTAHGVIMIFFVAMPLVTGLMNYLDAAADRCARRVVPVPEQLQLLDDHHRRRAGDGVAVPG